MFSVEPIEKLEIKEGMSEENREVFPGVPGMRAQKVFVPGGLTPLVLYSDFPMDFWNHPCKAERRR